VLFGYYLALARRLGDAFYASPRQKQGGQWQKIPREPPMNLIQFLDENGERAVAVVEGATARTVTDAKSVYDIALAALNAGQTLAEIIATTELGKLQDRDTIATEGRLLSPIDHPDPAHLYVTGTGLTHLGSASTRDAMHKGAKSEENLTDSM
jgi:hypothetical protein